MRKLGIALLALAVVFGLSTGVMADDAFLSDDLGDENDIDIEVDIESFAHIAELDTENDIEFTFDAPAEGGQEIQNNTRDFEFGTNDTVEVVLEESITDEMDVDWEDDEFAFHIALELDNFDDVYTNVDDEPEAYEDYGGFSPVDGGGTRTFTFEPGFHYGELLVAAGWYYEYSHVDETGEDWDETPWHDIDADTYEGEITVTIQEES